MKETNGGGELIISNNEIKGNDVGGDLNIGSLVIKFPPIENLGNSETLKNLISQHEKLKDDDPAYVYLLEELQSKIKNCESREVVGLKEKLTIAGREGYIDEALISSQKASRTISKLQHIKSYQIVFNHILGLILTRFRSYVLPLLKNGHDDIVINSTINSVIIEPLYNEVVNAGSTLSPDAVEGMLYFLTEKCHVEWM